MKFTEKTQNFNFWVFQLYLVQFNTGDVLIIGEWTLLELGIVRLFRNFSNCRKWKEFNFWVFQKYLVQMNPGDVLVIGKWILLVLGKVWFFETFLSVSYKNTRKTQKNQFLSFPIISSSNEPRGRASHWGMNTSGIGQCQVFSKFF